MSHLYARSNRRSVLRWSSSQSAFWFENSRSRFVVHRFVVRVPGPDMRIENWRPKYGTDVTYLSLWLLRCNHYLKHVTNTKYLQLLESPTSVTNIDKALIMRYLCQELLFDATFQKWIQGRLSKWAFRHFKLKSYFGFEFEISAGLITQLGHSWVCYEVYTFYKSVYTSKIISRRKNGFLCVL